MKVSRLGLGRHIVQHPEREGKNQATTGQVNGKVRGHLTVSTSADKETIEHSALTDATIAPLLKGKEIKKIIVVPGRLVNIVVVG